MNKRGSARDIIIIMVSIFLLTIGSFAMYFVANLSYDKMKQIDVINESASTMTVIDASKANSNKVDYFLFFVFIGMALALIITGYVIGGNFIFMAIYFIFIIISVVLSMIFANVWEDVTQMTIFGATISSFPMMNNIISYMPVYISIIGGLGMIAMFLRPYIGGER